MKIGDTIYMAHALDEKSKDVLGFSESEEDAIECLIEDGHEIIGLFKLELVSGADTLSEID